MNSAIQTKQDDVQLVNIRDFLRKPKWFLDNLENKKIRLLRRWEEIADILPVKKDAKKREKINWSKIKMWNNWEELLKFTKELRNEWE